MTDRNYEIIEHIAVLSENASGWRKELTLTKWFDNEPKYDIRDWSSDYSKCGKGVTLSNEEMNVLMACKSKLEDVQR